MSAEQLAQDAQKLFEGYLSQFWKEKATDLHLGQEKLEDAIRYSLLSGGKRFRPVLAMLTAQALGKPMLQVIPWAHAVECIHTYSLIHDDLPCMDNDDERRGKPTNHKVFGESTALLAGDALLTEAFAIIAKHYANDPEVAVHLVEELARASGRHGMVGGQAIDLNLLPESPSETILTLHRLKTGCLIEASIRGAAIAVRAPEKQSQALSDFAAYMGVAFQIADDLLDSTPDKPEEGSMVEALGWDASQKMLKDLTEKARQALRGCDFNDIDPLLAMAENNLNRKK